MGKVDQIGQIPASVHIAQLFFGSITCGNTVDGADVHAIACVFEIAIGVRDLHGELHITK